MTCSNLSRVHLFRNAETGELRASGSSIPRGKYTEYAGTLTIDTGIYGELASIDNASDGATIICDKYEFILKAMKR